MSATPSPQRLDPLGTLSSWSLPVLGGLVSFGYAVVSTVWHRDEVAHPLFAWLALSVLAVAVALLVTLARPLRAPLRRIPFISVLALAALASTLSTVAMWGADRFLQDDWGQIAFAVLLVSVAQLRPPRETGIAACAGAVLLGAVAMLPARNYAITVGPAVYGIVAATPVLALGLGAAAYARVMVRSTQRWRAVAREGMGRLEPEVRASAIRSVRQEQVTVLNSVVVPLFTAVAERGAVTERDAANAASVAAWLRRHAVAMASAGWLDDVIERAGTKDAVIDDPEDVVRHVSDDQRAAFGALIAALASGWLNSPEERGAYRIQRDRNDGFRYARSSLLNQPRLHIGATAEPQASGARIVLTATVAAPARVVKRSLMPYLSVLRVVSRDAALHCRQHTVTVGFGYDTV